MPPESDARGPAEEARKLLDNGWSVLLYRNALGEYVALAVRPGESVDAVLAAYQGDGDDDFEVETDEAAAAQADRLVFGGVNRRGGGGLTVAEALRAVTEKVLFRRLPPPPGVGGDA